MSWVFHKHPLTVGVSIRLHDYTGVQVDIEDQPFPHGTTLMGGADAAITDLDVYYSVAFERDNSLLAKFDLLP